MIRQYLSFLRKAAFPLRSLTALWCIIAFLTTAGFAQTVTVMATPNGGIQPQTVRDTSGTFHLVYFKGQPANGDLFYVRRKGAETAWSAPVRVNASPGSAVALGGIRGAQIAVGKGNRVHVVWNGSSMASQGTGGAPMLYAHQKDDGTFERERNLITWAGGIDGGGAIAADPAGNVYVTWHATPAGRDEAAGGVYLAQSADDGKTFAKETNILPSSLGACGCCSMKALADDAGNIFVLYRSATNNTKRDTYSLLSRDKGKTFQAEHIESWAVNVCPMSAFDLSQHGSEILGAWETQGQVSFARLNAATMKPIAAPGQSGNRKYPLAVRDSKGNTLFAWAEGVGWQRGGALAYQVYDASGAPTADRGRLPNAVPVWGVISAVPRPEGGFLLLH